MTSLRQDIKRQIVRIIEWITLAAVIGLVVWAGRKYG